MSTAPRETTTSQISLSASRSRRGAPEALETSKSMLETAAVLDCVLIEDLVNIVLHYVLEEPPRGRFVRAVPSIAPRGVALWEEQDVLLVIDATNRCICVHKLSDGTFLRQFGQLLPSPFLVAVSELDGLALVTEVEASSISIWCVADGSFVRRWNSQTITSSPSGMAISSTLQLVFIAHPQTHWVQVFNFEGVFIRSFGSFGNGPGQLNEPSGIAVRDGFVYIVESRSCRVSVFSELDGSFVRHIAASWIGDYHQRPCGIAVGVGWLAIGGDDDHIIVVNSTNSENGAILEFLNLRKREYGYGSRYRKSCHGLMCWNATKGTLIATNRSDAGGKFEVCFIE